MAIRRAYRVVLSFAFIVGSLAVAACGSSDASDPGAGTGASADGAASACAVQPTFTSIYTQVLSSKTCAISGCHASPGQSGLSLDGSAAAVYQLLVNKPSEGSLLQRVAPSAPTSSFLYLKLSEATPPSGTRMPQVAQALPACEIDAVKAWIEAGAPQN